MRPMLFGTLATLVCLSIASAQDTKSKPGPEVGKPAPEIKGQDINGRKFKLSDYRGKVVVLAFWAHW
jgi:cytochrome oxidase Cu insertion factor (SCO1/SenC/PrrC family)